MFSSKIKTILFTIACLTIGMMMLYRGILNLTQYIDFDAASSPRFDVNWARFWLGPIFLGGVFGIYIMYRGHRIGWWIFTALNFLVGYWFIFILEDIWQHHVMPHIVFSAVFLPFYRALKSIGQSFMSLLSIKWFVGMLAAVPFVYAFVNRVVINVIAKRVRNRPHPLSTVHDYVSWKGMTDKRWSSRHVAANIEYNKDLPPVNQVAELFKRTDGFIPCPKSTCLFPAFAQYLTDGFIRTRSDITPDMIDEDGNLNDEAKQRLRQNTSNHDIDLCPLYGLNETHTRALRKISNAPEDRGLLRSQLINGEEFPEFLFQSFDDDRTFEEANLPLDAFVEEEVADILYKHGLEIAKGFEALDLPLGLKKLAVVMDDDDEDKANYARTQIMMLFAVGGDRANSATQTSMMNTLFLREHNRLAREIGKNKDSKDWDSDRIFETARNIVIVEFIKIVVNDYINHIAPMEFQLKADPKAAWKANWNRPNWITVEFSLLYRWHALIPDYIYWGENKYPSRMTFMNNIPLVSGGLAGGFQNMAEQRAGRIGPRNTNDALMFVETASIDHGRACELAPYVEYLEYTKSKLPKSMKDISTDPLTLSRLESIYDTPDEVEFFTGIFCEDRVPNSPLPRTILTLVAVDAFSQALTNPLLSEHAYNAGTFSKYGMDEIEALESLEDLVRRNVDIKIEANSLSMTQIGWRKEKA